MPTRMTTSTGQGTTSSTRLRSNNWIEKSIFGSPPRTSQGMRPLQRSSRRCDCTQITGLREGVVGEIDHRRAATVEICGLKRGRDAHYRWQLLHDLLGGQRLDLIDMCDLSADEDCDGESQDASRDRHPRGRRGSVELLRASTDGCCLCLASLGRWSLLGLDGRQWLSRKRERQPCHEPSAGEEGQHVDGDHALDHVGGERTRH